MALTFPLPLAQFALLLPIESAAWQLKRFEEITRTRDGGLRVAEMADPRWHVAVSLAGMHAGEAARAIALIEAHGAGRPCLLHDPLRPGPAADLSGTILGAAAPTLSAVGTRSLRVAGLPVGYALAAGDLLAVVHSGTAQTLHRVLEPATAAAGGVTGFFDVDPPPRAAAAAGQAVQLRQAAARMVIVPGSVRPGRSVKAWVTGMGFEAVEA